MSVVLGPGRAKIAGTSVSPPAGLAFTTQAMYDTLNDANLTLTIATSDPTNPRIDAIFEQIQDSYYAGSTNTAVAAVATGFPAVSPSAPAIPANSLLIAYVAVAANATSIVTGNITYQAPLAALLGSAVSGTLTLGSGFTVHTGQTTKLEKNGNIVTLAFALDNSAGTATAAIPSGVVIATLPVGFRPSVNPVTTFVGFNNSGGVIVAYTIDTAGVIRAYPQVALGAGATLYGSVSFSVA